MTKKLKQSYIVNTLADMQHSKECYGRLEHKVISINNNSIRFMFPLGLEEGKAISPSMQRIRDFGKECMQMGWLMAIEEIRNKIL